MISVKNKEHYPLVFCSVTSADLTQDQITTGPDRSHARIYNRGGTSILVTSSLLFLAALV